MWINRSKTQVYHPSSLWTFIYVSQSCPAPCESEPFGSLLCRSLKFNQTQGKVNLFGLAVLPHPLVTHLPRSWAFPEKNKLSHKVNIFYMSLGVAFVKRIRKENSTNTLKEEQHKKYNIACTELKCI